MKRPDFAQHIFEQKSLALNEFWIYFLGKEAIQHSTGAKIEIEPYKDKLLA